MSKSGCVEEAWLGNLCWWNFSWRTVQRDLGAGAKVNHVPKGEEGLLLLLGWL